MGTVAGREDCMVEGLLGVLHEGAAVAVAARVHPLVLALEHQVRRQVVVHAVGPGALAASVFVELSVGKVEQRVAKTAPAHEVEGIDAALLVAFGVVAGPLVRGDPGAVVVLVADGRETAFLAVQAQEVDLCRRAPWGDDRGAEVRVDVRFGVPETQRAEVIGFQADVRREDLLVVDVVQVIHGEQVAVGGLAAGHLERHGADAGGHGVEGIGTFVVAQLDLAVDLIRQPQPRVGDTDVEGFGIHVDRQAQPPYAHRQAFGRFPGEVSPLQVAFPGVLFRLEGALHGHPQRVGEPILELATQPGELVTAPGVRCLPADAETAPFVLAPQVGEAGGAEAVELIVSLVQGHCWGGRDKACDTECSNALHASTALVVGKVQMRN